MAEENDQVTIDFMRQMAKDYGLDVDLSDVKDFDTALKLYHDALGKHLHTEQKEKDGDTIDFSKDRPNLPKFNIATGEKLSSEEAKKAFEDKYHIPYDEALNTYFSNNEPHLAKYNKKTGVQLTPEEALAAFQERYGITYDQAQATFNNAHSEKTVEQEKGEPENTATAVSQEEKNDKRTVEIGTHEGITSIITKDNETGRSSLDNIVNDSFASYKYDENGKVSSSYSYSDDLNGEKRIDKFDYNYKTPNDGSYRHDSFVGSEWRVEWYNKEGQLIDSHKEINEAVCNREREEAKKHMQSLENIVEKETNTSTLDSRSVQNTEQQEQPDLHPVRVEQAMPARTQETQQEQPDLHPVRVEQAMPANTQEETRTVEDKEKAFSESFIKFSRVNSEENGKAMLTMLSDLIKDYQMQGLSASEAQNKMTDVLSATYDLGIEQGLDPNMLRSNISKFSAQLYQNLFQKEQTTTQEDVTIVQQPEPNKRSSSRDFFEDAEDAVIIEDEQTAQNLPVPQDQNADEAQNTITEDVTIVQQPDPNKRSSSRDLFEDAEDAVIIEDEQTAQNLPVPQDQNADEAQNFEEAQQEAEKPDHTQEQEPEKPDHAQEQEPEKPDHVQDRADGVFRFGLGDEPDHTNTPGPTPEKGSLKQQLLDTAFKNRYLLVEDSEMDPPRTCPFGQLKVRTLEDHENDEKNPYVKMELETGTRIFNRPGQIDMYYNTTVSPKRDEKGNVVGENRETQLSFEDCVAAVRLGMEKGWTSATLEGPEEYKKQMYLAMTAMGMKVIGYEPSEELKKEAEELAKKLANERDHAASIDKRFPALEQNRINAGINEPEEIGREFMEDMDKAGLGYHPELEPDKANAGNEHDDAVKPNEGNANDDVANEGIKPQILLPERVDNNQQQAEEVNADNKPQILLPELSNGNEIHVRPPEHMNNPSSLPEGVVPKHETDLVHVTSVSELSNGNEIHVRPPEHMNNPSSLPEGVVPKHETGLVHVTPAIENKLTTFSQTAVAALEKTDPQKAQQATRQLEATNGVANRLQIAGKVANEAKGNDAKAAQQQHNKETALILASRSNKNTK